MYMRKLTYFRWFNQADSALSTQNGYSMGNPGWRAFFLSFNIVTSLNQPAVTFANSQSVNSLTSTFSQ